MEHDRHEIIVEEVTPSHGRVVLEPLERGYGTTLGNALRRVLLSSIPGAGIVAVRVDGVLHEFSTIPGVREDVIELLLNLKHVPVRVSGPGTDVKVLRLEAEGPKVVRAADIQGDADVEFVDPEAVICTLDEGHRVSMDLYIERGVGYAPIDRPRPSYLPVDALLIDAIFSPVKRVRYEVQDVRSGQRTDYDRLVLEVWTNGVVSFRDAVAEASSILSGYFRGLSTSLWGQSSAVTAGDEDFFEEKDEEDLQEVPAVCGEDDSVLSRPIKDLGLSVRSENCLLRGGIHRIGDLVSRPKEELLKIRNLGKISLREIEEKLGKFGLSLKGEEPSGEADQAEDLQS